MEPLENRAHDHRCSQTVPTPFATKLWRFSVEADFCVRAYRYFFSGAVSLNGGLRANDVHAGQFRFIFAAFLFFRFVSLLLLFRLCCPFSSCSTASFSSAASSVSLALAFVAFPASSPVGLLLPYIEPFPFRLAFSRCVAVCVCVCTFLFFSSLPPSLFAFPKDNKRKQGEAPLRFAFSLRSSASAPLRAERPSLRDFLIFVCVLLYH